MSSHSAPSRGPLCLRYKAFDTCSSLSFLLASAISCSYALLPAAAWSRTVFHRHTFCQLYRRLVWSKDSLSIVCSRHRFFASSAGWYTDAPFSQGLGRAAHHAELWCLPSMRSSFKNYKVLLYAIFWLPQPLVCTQLLRLCLFFLLWHATPWAFGLVQRSVSNASWDPQDCGWQRD